MTKIIDFKKSNLKSKQKKINKARLLNNNIELAKIYCDDFRQELDHYLEKTRSDNNEKSPKQ